MHAVTPSFLDAIGHTPGEEVTVDITAIAGVVRPGDTLIIGMHPDSDPDMDFTALREALPTTPIVVILGAESMAIHRGDNNQGAAKSGAPTPGSECEAGCALLDSREGEYVRPQFDDDL